ncbi:MAG TPA: glycosyltransferase family 4 protein [Acidobacteriaceae bacterium]|jgi:glycosyltransferase involved in cell wall biosynthesis
MKVLLMAYECSPYRGSEWAVGWGRLLQASRAAEAHVITSESNFAALKRAREEGLLPEGVHIYTPPQDARRRKTEDRPGMFAYNYTAYHHWQKLALKLARELHSREHFDLVHQVNVCTFREPGYTWQLGIPYLWGPVGGSQDFPASFLTMLPAKEAFKEAARSVSNWLSLRFKKRVRQAARSAARIVAANSTNQRDYEHVFGRKIDLLLETGLHRVDEPDRSRWIERVEKLQRGEELPPLRLLWSGQFDTRKALPILLHALAQLQGKVRFTLRVLGDGAMHDVWIQEARSLGLRVVLGHDREADSVSHNTVEFLGKLPFQAAVAEMNSADLFCFTSLRDTSGNVVLEALAAGVPVVCFDHQGAGDMVIDTSGVKLPVTSPKRAIADWAHTLRTLSEDPARLLALSEGTTEQARRFLWSANGDWINAAYRRLAGEREPGTQVEKKETVSA